MEEFERSQPIVGWEINPSESTTMGEQLMQETSANPVPQASNLNSDTLATAVSLWEKFTLTSVQAREDRAEKRLRMRHLRPSRRENLDSSNKFLM